MRHSEHSKGSKITVEMARHTLGKKFDVYSDEEMQRLIDDFYYLANFLLDTI